MWGINGILEHAAGSGHGNTELGCAVIDVAETSGPGAPIGFLEHAYYTAVGWAFDPDAPDEAVRVATQTIVHYPPAGFPGASTLILTDSEPSIERSDVQAVYPQAPLVTGFVTSMETIRERHFVTCAYVIEAGGDGTAFLGCRGSVVGDSPV